VPQLVVGAFAFFLFSRTAGAESVRWVQILLLFVSGVCVGMALGSIRRSP
jgi:ABC-type uncharacterized transport system permease subunit